MSNSFRSEKDYSTVRSVTTELPIIENRVEDSFETLLFLPRNEGRQGEGGLRTRGCFKKPDPRKPLISIVTVVYNGKAHLEETILSVMEQDYDNVEYIVIDGGSTDGTIEIINKYEEYIDYWVSEKDNGIYDAMNKGIKLALGDLVGLINADDFYEKEALRTVAHFYSLERPDILYGDTYHMVEKEKIYKKAHETGIRYGIAPYSYRWIWVKMLFGHPSAFVAREVYKKEGLYDSSFKICGDYDFFIRAVMHRRKLFHIPKALSCFRDGGISTIENGMVAQENFLARKKNSQFLAYIIEILLTLMKAGSRG